MNEQMVVSLTEEQQQWLEQVCNILTDFSSASGYSYTATVTGDQLQQLLDAELIDPDYSKDWGTAPTNEDVAYFLREWGGLFTGRGYFVPDEDTFYFTGIDTKPDVSAKSLWGKESLRKTNQCWAALMDLTLRLDSAEFGCKFDKEKPDDFPQVSVSFF